MSKLPLVVLVGDSLLISGVALCLENKYLLKAIQIESDDIGIKEQLDFLKPDLIVFDLDSPNMLLIHFLLTECPGFQLMGIESDHNRVVVFNSQQHPTRTMNDLFQEIQAITKPQASRMKGGGIEWDDNTAVSQPKHA